MQFSMSKPCSDCPFRKDIAFFLGKDRRQEIVDSLLKGDQTFACHKTVHYEKWEDNGSPYVYSGDEQHCAGALILLHKTGHLWDNFLLRLAKQIGWLDESKLDRDAPVFDTIEQFTEGENL